MLIVTQKNEPIRIGQLLVQRGVMSQQQVLEVLEKQKQTQLPFGVLAERMFEVTVESIEQAWIEQYCQLTQPLELNQEEVDVKVLKLINRRQAWQFEILPLRIEPTGELLMAASRHRLARAVTFVANRLRPVVYFRVARSDQLRQFLNQHYPMPEITQEIIRRAKELAHHQPAA